MGRYMPVKRPPPVGSLSSGWGRGDTHGSQHFRRSRAARDFRVTQKPGNPARPRGFPRCGIPLFQGQEVHPLS
ncbi:hypothetical protein CEXT_776641 [Caerostris extrusa]|uniref:Uncharacterized protein n=1 Tax=Caerostris extrusa TaxID=172846 RepID=A0AAV4WJK8_CAEEX|nr:hypothetical protein CEXT_776641 [Caerostris extrusa]